MGRGSVAAQGTHPSLFGGQEPGRGEDGHVDRAFARERAGYSSMND